MITIHILVLAGIVLVAFVLGFFIAKNMAKHNPTRYQNIDLQADRAAQSLRDAQARVKSGVDAAKNKFED